MTGKVGMKRSRELTGGYCLAVEPDRDYGLAVGCVLSCEEVAIMLRAGHFTDGCVLTRNGVRFTVVRIGRMQVLAVNADRGAQREVGKAEIMDGPAAPLQATVQVEVDGGRNG